MNDKQRIRELESALRVIRTWAICDVDDRSEYVIKADLILILIDRVLPMQLNEVKGVKRRSGETGSL